MDAELITTPLPAASFKFTPWVNWNNRLAKLGDLTLPGIYALMISERGQESTPFSWNEDIVYFGMTASKAGLKGRLSQFDNSMRGNKGPGHGGALRFRNDHHDGSELAQVLYVAVCGFPRPTVPNVAEEYRLLGQIAMAECEAIAYFSELFPQISLPLYNNKRLKPKYRG